MKIIVLGAGMMGRAIAYDLCKYSNFESITITDKDRKTPMLIINNPFLSFLATSIIFSLNFVSSGNMNSHSKLSSSVRKGLFRC